MRYSNKNTSCKDCCFAVYDGVTQTGCERNLLEKFKSVSANVVECYDGEAEFFVIENRKCPSYRPKAWLQRAMLQRAGDNGDQIDELIQYENQLAFHAVLFTNDKVGDIKATVNSLIDQTLTPAYLTIVRRKFNTVKPHDIIPLIEDAPFKWRMENMVVVLPDESIIHNVGRLQKLPFLTTFKAGYEAPQDFFSTINSFIVDELKTFAMLDHIDGENGLTIPWSVHEYWYRHGDHDKTIESNIRECQKETKDQIIFQMTDLQQAVQKSC